MSEEQRRRFASRRAREERVAAASFTAAARTKGLDVDVRIGASGPSIFDVTPLSGPLAGSVIRVTAQKMHNDPDALIERLLGEHGHLVPTASDCTFNELNEPLTTEERDAFADMCRLREQRGEIGPRCDASGLHPITLWARYMTSAGVDGTRYWAGAASVRKDRACVRIAGEVMHRHEGHQAEGTELTIYSYVSYVGVPRENLPSRGDTRKICGSQYRVAKVGCNCIEDFEHGWWLLRLERIEENTTEEESQL